MREIVQITKHTDYEGVYQVSFSFDGRSPKDCYVNIEADSELGAATRFMYQQDSTLTPSERRSNGWLRLGMLTTVGGLVDEEIRRYHE